MAQDAFCSKTVCHIPTAIGNLTKANDALQGFHAESLEHKQMTMFYTEHSNKTKSGFACTVYYRVKPMFPHSLEHNQSPAKCV